MTASVVLFFVAMLVMVDGSFDITVRSAIADMRASIPDVFDDSLWLVSKLLEKSSGVTASLIVAAGIGAFVAFSNRDWRPGVLLFGTVFGVLAATIALKEIFDRPAPLEWSSGEPSGRAFPSGHAAQAIAVWGIAAFLWQRAHAGATRVLVPVVIGLFVVAAGLARLVLEAHWTTDVLAGWAVGAFVVCMALALGELLPTEDRPRARRRHRARAAQSEHVPIRSRR